MKGANMSRKYEMSWRNERNNEKYSKNSMLRYVEKPANMYNNDICEIRENI